jgi:sigma-E factor negative regulatory protein RseC
MEKYIRETGTIVAKEGEQVRVCVKRHASCASCGACGMGNKEDLTLLVVNTVGARVGDQVLLEMPTAKLYQAALLVYTLPLGMLLIGFWAGQTLGRWLGLTAHRGEIGGIVTGFAFLALTYWAIHHWDRRRQIGARFQPRLIRII